MSQTQCFEGKQKRKLLLGHSLLAGLGDESGRVRDCGPDGGGAGRRAGRGPGAAQGGAGRGVLALPLLLQRGRQVLTRAK